MEDEPTDESVKLLDRIYNQKWKIRMRAYKDISELFYNEYSKECHKVNFQQNTLNGEEEEESSVNPFD